MPASAVRSIRSCDSMLTPPATALMPTFVPEVISTAPDVATTESESAACTVVSAADDTTTSLAAVTVTSRLSDRTVKFCAATTSTLPPVDCSWAPARPSTLTRSAAVRLTSPVVDLIRKLVSPSMLMSPVEVAVICSVASSATVAPAIVTEASPRMLTLPSVGLVVAKEMPPAADARETPFAPFILTIPAAVSSSIESVADNETSDPDETFIDEEAFNSTDRDAFSAIPPAADVNFTSSAFMEATPLVAVMSTDSAAVMLMSALVDITPTELPDRRVVLPLTTVKFCAASKPISPEVEVT